MGKKKTKLTLEKKYNLTGWAEHGAEAQPHRLGFPAASLDPDFCILFLSNGTGNPAFF